MKLKERVPAIVKMETPPKNIVTKELLLLIGAFLIYVVGSRGYIDVVDPQIRYMVAHRIWYQGSILLSKEDGEKLIGSSPPGTFFLPRHENGEYISFYGLGQSLTMLPSVIGGDLLARFVAPEKQAEIRYLTPQLIFMSFFLPLFAALTLFAVAILGRRVGIPRTQAIWTAFALGFGTFFLFYTKTLCHNIEIAMWFLLGLVVLSGGARDAPYNPWRLAVASFLMGLTLLYRQEALIPVALTLAGIVYWEWRVKHRALGVRALAALAAPVVLLGCCVLAHNYARSGSVLNAWPGGKLPDWHRPLFADFPLANFLGMLFGSAKGFFWYSPLFLAASLLIWPKARRWSQLLTVAAVPVLAFTAFWSSTDWIVTEGGWGPRYLLPLTPFYAIALSFALTPLIAHPRWRAAIAAFVIACVGFEAAVSFESHNTPVQQFLAVNKALAAKGTGTDGVQLSGFHALMSAGRLRNLGVPLGDHPAALAEWNSPPVQALRADLADDLWWLKLGKKFGSSKLSHLLTVLACMTLFAGVLCLGWSLRPEKVIEGPKKKKALLQGSIDGLAADLAPASRELEQIDA